MLLSFSWCPAAFAYRPFDGTDAAVAEPGVLEIELGPSQYLVQAIGISSSLRPWC